MNEAKKIVDAKPKKEDLTLAETVSKICGLTKSAEEVSNVLTKLKACNGSGLLRESVAASSACLLDYYVQLRRLELHVIHLLEGDDIPAPVALVTEHSTKKPGSTKKLDLLIEEAKRMAQLPSRYNKREWFSKPAHSFRK